MAEEQLLSLQVLEDQLAAAQTLPEKVSALNNLSRHWVDKDSERGRELAHAAFDLAQSENLIEHQFDALLNLSRHYHRLGDLSLALQQALDAYNLLDAAAPSIRKINVLERLGTLYDHLGNYAGSLTYNLEALKLAQEEDYGEVQGRVLNAIGILYNRTGNYRQELATYQRALQLSQASQDIRNEAVLYNNIAMAYCALQEYDLALENAHRCLIYIRNQEAWLLEANALCTIADVYMAMGNDGAARDYLEKGLAAATQQKFEYMMLYAHLNLGRILTRSAEYDKAWPHLQTALDMSEQQQARHEWFQCHEALSALYKATGDLAQALYHHEQFHALKETIFNEESRQTLRNLQALHQTENARRDAEIYQLKNEELEAEIRLRRMAETALRERTLELENQNAELDAFAHTVAHDLKSPLSVLLGLTSDAPEFLALLSPEEVEQSWEMIKRSARKLINIVDELLLLASVRGQDIQPDPLDMQSLVSEALARVGHHLDTYGGEIILPEQWLIALGHGPWIEEVWVNYLSNALKYGGQPPVVTCGNDLLPDGQVCFWVRDNGKGLSTEEIERLFIPFERLHQVHTKGYGLGLSIVRRIVEKLGGRVGAKPNQDAQGSTFYFTLPLAQQS